MRLPLSSSLLGVILVVIAALAIGCASRSHTTPSPSVCRPSNLVGTHLPGGGAAGTIFFTVVLENRGPACTLQGYPGLRITSAHGLLPTRVVHGGAALMNRKPRAVNLAPLGKASVIVSYEDVPVGNEKICPTGTGLRLRPPGSNGWLTIGVATEACGHGTLHTSPLLAGIHSSQ
jgi:hypothetical protein